MTERAVTMKIYEDGVPAHAQVFVHPEGVVADLLDVDGQVVGTAVYDRVDVERVAERQGLEIIYVSGYADADTEQPEELSEVSLEPDDVDADGQPNPPDASDDPEETWIVDGKEVAGNPAADDDEPETAEATGDTTTEEEE